MIINQIRAYHEARTVSVLYEGVTSRSKHSLDVDGRFGKMVSVAVKIMRQMIESALARHEKVRVIVW